MRCVFKLSRAVISALLSIGDRYRHVFKIWIIRAWTINTRLVDVMAPSGFIFRRLLTWLRSPPLPLTRRQDILNSGLHELRAARTQTAQFSAFNIKVKQLPEARNSSANGNQTKNENNARIAITFSLPVSQAHLKILTNL